MLTDFIRVHMLKAGKMFEGTTEQVCMQIGQQIDSDLQTSGH